MKRRCISWSPEATARLHKLHALNIPIVDLAERFGVSENAIISKLGKKRYPRKTPPRVCTPIQRQMIVTPWFVDIVDGLQTRIVRLAE